MWRWHLYEGLIEMVTWAGYLSQSTTGAKWFCSSLRQNGSKLIAGSRYGAEQWSVMKPTPRPGPVAYDVSSGVHVWASWLATLTHLYFLSASCCVN